MKKLLFLLIFLPLLNFAQVQYTMPSEEDQHEGTWLQWPHNFTYPPWHQEDNELAFIEMVAALETGENVHIIVYDTNEQIHVQQVLSTASVPLTNVDASFGAQLIGVLSINIFVFVVAYLVWSIMHSLFGIRLSKEAQAKGTDVTETGVIAYAIRD